MRAGTINSVSYEVLTYTLCEISGSHGGEYED
jgi:hypothetical protein